ncbi:MAG: TIGR04283 family arsenosugar biosynthesis glycosyltransferase [Verrucomicrobia bacterium]|nr:TIGR04283 family arsenosugar biosynthesis glycosyltransferase [Verrucomicrobiota bacterium]
MTISVVIPTLNEAEELPATLGHVGRIPEVSEVLVSDGGSTDGTPGLARDAGARVISGPSGRGGQLRRGAAESVGDVVLLLHADTWLPPEAGAAIRQVLASPGVVGGAFEKAFRNPPWMTRGSRLRCRFRMRWLQFAYGDQAIFVRREVLVACGGVPDVPLMEEHLLCAALRPHGRLALARAAVSTSARRFRRRGPLRTYLLMGLINLRWHLGASPESLSKTYQGGW